MMQSKTADQLLEQKFWMDTIVTIQESYLKQYAEVKAKELLKRKIDEVKAKELLTEQEKAKTLLQSKTANRTKTFREWLVKQEDDKR